MGILSTGRQLAKNLKSAGRVKEIAGVLASHGFQDVLERVQIGQKVLSRIPHNKELENLSIPERIRMSFEELGPTFVKLGQLLATRPDLIPKDWTEEFKKFHDKVKPIDYEELKDTLEDLYGDIDEVFLEFDKVPLASASIAQVHKAKLKSGDEVVLKIRRPNIVETIQEDLVVLYSFANLLEKYYPETRVYNPVGIVDEFFKSMDLETNFIIEANNILRFKKNLADDPTVKIPNVYIDLSNEKVLVMEMIKGTPLSQKDALKEEGFDPKVFVKRGMKLFFKMVFHDRFFHGDLHAGNLFILPDSRIGLVDFGVVGRMSYKVRESIASMFVALANEDYERLAFDFVDLAPYNEKVDTDKFARELRDTVAPYFGLSFKNVNSGKILMEATGLAAKNHIQVPSDLVMFFKAIVTVEGMGRLVIKDFDVLEEITEISSEIVKSKLDPNQIKKDLQYLAQDSAKLITTVPRQARQFIRKINSPDFNFKVNIAQVDDLKRSVETSSNLMFLGLLIGSLVVGSSLALNYETEATVIGLPLVSGIGYLVSFFLSMLAFYNYIRK